MKHLRFLLVLLVCFSVSFVWAQETTWESYKNPEELLVLIMQFHEDNTDARYYASSPRISFDHSMNYWSVGRYDAKNKKIILHPRFAVIRGRSEFLFLRDVLSHELGHFFTHLYIERFVPNSWLALHFPCKTDPGPEHFGRFIVVEGIGEYFRQIFTPGVEPQFASGSWNKEWSIKDFKYKSFRDWLFYTGGYDLVKPIFDKYGVCKGMKLLLENELIVKIPDTSVVFKYREKLLKGRAK